MRRMATLRTRLERLGQPIGSNDLLIAAHAVALGCTLVTDNEREFSRVEGISWSRTGSASRFDEKRRALSICGRGHGGSGLRELRGLVEVGAIAEVGVVAGRGVVAEEGVVVAAGGDGAAIEGGPAFDVHGELAAFHDLVFDFSLAAGAFGDAVGFDGGLKKVARRFAVTPVSRNRWSAGAGSAGMACGGAQTLSEPHAQKL